MVKKQGNKLLQIISHPVALFIFVLSVIFKFGTNKLRAQGMICDPVHDPPVCDPVHEPPPQPADLSEIVQKPVIFLSLLIILFFPIYIHKVIKQFFVVQFTTWQLLKTIIKYCFVWSVAFYLILVPISFIVSWSTTGNFLNQANVSDIFVSPLFQMAIPMFFIATTISGIEMLIIALKDRRFLLSGLILFFLPVILLMLFGFFARLFFIPSYF